jgi:hypothetical protein
MITDSKYFIRVYAPDFRKVPQLNPNHTYELLEQFKPNELADDRANLLMIHALEERKSRKQRNCGQLFSSMKSLFSSRKSKDSTAKKPNSDL